MKQYPVIASLSEDFIKILESEKIRIPDLIYQFFSSGKEISGIVYFRSEDQKNIRFLVEGSIFVLACELAKSRDFDFLDNIFGEICIESYFDLLRRE